MFLKRWVQLMAERKIKWTEQQRRAIIARGSDVLVTASAGTGKTAVLSGRCVSIVSDKSVCPDVWSILVLTFTDMAAEQMRSRIAEQLRAAFVESGDQHLREQIMLLQGADISTIHSFCKRLITEHFYKLGLDPTFCVIDGDEQKLLKAEVLEKTIDWAWQQSNLRAALEQLLYRRDLHTNDGFLARIIDLSDFLDGVISRERWYERTSVLAEAASPFAAPLGKRQKEIVAGDLQQILGQLRHAQKLYEDENPGGDWAKKCEDTFIKPVAKCIELLKAGDWDKCAERIRDFKKPMVKKPEELSKTVAELIQKTVKRAIDSFGELSNLAVLNPEYLDKVGNSASLQTKVLIELVKKFDRLYSQAKRAVNCLDFADLEHYALKLLTDEDSTDDNPLPSETALALRQRYKYIFVDEYQDINSVQQRILQMLSPGGNILEVGDVKQSIYAFRGAEPDIFLEQLKLASAEAENAPNGLRVDLNLNFRSAKGILDFVNRIFSRIMTPSFTKIDYDDSAQLKPALTDKSKDSPLNDSKPVVEFHILDEQKLDVDLQNNRGGEFADDEGLNPVRNSTTISNGVNVISSRQRQAAMIAQRIRQMVGAETRKAEFQIYDKQQDKSRDVEYRDIVILMRSLAKKANDYVEVLRLAGVPVSCQATAGYFETTEISDLLCLLKVLDNPQRDIELAAVLRSPFFKISDSELAKIKVQSKVDKQRSGNSKFEIRNSKFSSCVLQYCANGPDAELAGRLKKVLEQIEQWRTLARRGNLADLIWQIYRQTGFLSFVSALPNGQARRANLLKLHDRAIQFEGFASSAGIPSLTRFVKFIEKLQEVGQDWSPAEPEAAVGNAVRILSVHKSKGLEFPVVFLAELQSKFNKRDIYADFLADAADILGLQIIDRESNSKLPSLAHQVIAERKLSTALAEEMRILYVATTRARDRLVLTASEKKSNCQDIIYNGFFRKDTGQQTSGKSTGVVPKDAGKQTSGNDTRAFFGDEPIADWQLRRCQSPLEWILYGLSDQKNLHSALETGLADRVVDDDLFSIKLYSQTELKQLSRYIFKLRADRSRRPGPIARKLHTKRMPSKSALSQLKKSFAWRYKQGDAPLLPAKRSVTQLTHRDDEYVRIDYSKALARKPSAVVAAEPGLAEPVEGRLVGIATHLIIAHLDLAKPVNKEAVEETKEKLLVDGAMTEPIAEHVDTGSIITFFESNLGQTILDAENDVWREWPFTFAIPTSEWQNSSLVNREPYPERATSDELLRRTPNGGATIIVQGIIDMLVQTPQGLLVIDFKTDELTAEQVSERAKLYRQQLELYSRASGAILKKPIEAKWLYFLTPGCAIEVE